LKQILLGLAIHSHQPLGNFPWVFEDAYSRAYLPMLEALERHPGIHVSLHYSGCLIDWLAQNHAEFFSLLKALLARGQVELMGGGYYEPILPAIPDADKLGQIRKMGDFIHREFGMQPSGMWLAERVWEPYLAKILAEAGVEWTLVDDTAFKMVGLGDEALSGYFLTEEQGRCIKIFPISKYLRYSIPWHSVSSVIDYLRGLASESGERIAVLGDDGEKFGIWPETYEHCWEKGWVDDFFKAVEDNADWLKTIRLGDYADRYLPAGRVYLPCASYDEMMEWSLPAGKSGQCKELKQSLEDEGRDDIVQFMHSGYWRNFLVKYPEINRLHKKMLLVHDKVYRAHAVSKGACGLDYLWRAQCNCPYWHGVFGGIYLSDIRAVTYSNLIEAENRADKVLQNSQSGFNWQEMDYDGDGRGEVIAETRNFNLYLSPAEGGTIIEWDLRKQAYNLLSSVSRKPEAYHKALTIPHPDDKSPRESEVASIHDVIRVKDRDYARFLVYDRLPRSSLIDHFFNSNAVMEQFERNEYEESGRFAGMPYEFQVETIGSKLYVKFKRLGQVCTGSNPVDLTLEKAVILSDTEEVLNINYRFTNRGNLKIDTLFGSEWNINLLGGGHNNSACYRLDGRELDDMHLDSRGVTQDTEHLYLGNKQLGIEMKLLLDRPVTVWRFPVESLSNSEGGIEKIYQCSCIVILLPLSIEPEQQVEFNYSWNLFADGFKNPSLL
jgi:alpha-amylase